MFTLLTPSALLALLGLLVPLAIHLWNRRPGRTVQVGSVRWLAASANRRLRSLKLEQLLLLLLRAAVVAVLAVALAGPAWQRPAPPARGQVLVSPELLTSAALPNVRPLVDSLRRRGYEVSRLEKGLPSISAEEWTALVANPAASDSISYSTESSFLWARAAQAAQRFADRPVHLLTPAKLADLQGTRPNLPPNLTWQLIPTPDSGAWVQAAGLNGANKVRLLIGRSDEEKTTFQAVTVARPTTAGTLPVPGLPALRYETRANNQAAVHLVSDSVATPVQAPMRLRVYYTPDQAEDARYLAAALRAASSGLLVPPVITVSATAPSPSDSLTWVFWLSKAPMPAAWKLRVAEGLNWWQQAAGTGAAVAASFGPVGAETLIPILRRDTAAILPPAAAIWTDGSGQPVLSGRAEGRGQVYTLHTRLNPTWSGLPDSPELPALLLGLLQPPIPTPALARNDQRVVAPSQVQAAIQRSSNSAKKVPQKAVRPAPDTFTDLRAWAVLFAALLFGLERLLARQRPISSPLSPA
ncbi:BatA domain-containing protein [Hymenobacter radiodurans]|uniref:BatA domain-containing protein n=1 Tax=Hymenobacter radiodurans TaxID=2496028 RepID=UPI0010588A61|nr:BatA domain-containing protein [Hymenobacter radiodurans]